MTGVASGFDCPAGAGASVFGVDGADGGAEVAAPGAPAREVESGFVAGLCCAKAAATAARRNKAIQRRISVIKDFNCMELLFAWPKELKV
jgi:hypothetical protein